MSRCPDYKHVYGIDNYLVETLPEERESAADIPLTDRCDDGEEKSFAETVSLLSREL